MEHNLFIGMEYEVEKTVIHSLTADFFGSGDVLVFATPCLILEMEQAALLAVQSGLCEGFTTVGTKVNIEHCAATPIGMKVRAKAILREIDGRRLVFDVTASDEKEIIGRGTHERFIILREKFMAKVNGKLGGI